MVSAAIFAFSSHINLFPPSFMHAARATRPLALITSQLLLMIIQSLPSVFAILCRFFFGCSSHPRVDFFIFGWDGTICMAKSKGCTLQGYWQISFVLLFHTTRAVHTPHHTSLLFPTQVKSTIFPENLVHVQLNLFVWILHSMNSLLRVESKYLDSSFVSYSEM